MKTIKQENVSYRYKWLARDEDGELYAYVVKPDKMSAFWVCPPDCDETSVGHIKENDFTRKIKWEDEEPTRIITGNELYHIKISDKKNGFLNMVNGEFVLRDVKQLSTIKTTFTLEEIEQLNPKLVEFAVLVEY